MGGLPYPQRDPTVPAGQFPCHTHHHGAGRPGVSSGPPLDMLTQDVCKLHNAPSRLPTTAGIVSGPEEGERIADRVGPSNKAGVLMNRGLLIVGSAVG